METKNAHNKHLNAPKEWERTHRIGYYLLAVSIGFPLCFLCWHLSDTVDLSSLSSALRSPGLWISIGIFLPGVGTTLMLSILLKSEFENMKNRLGDQSKKLISKSQQISHVAFTARHDLRGSLDGLLFSMELIREQFKDLQHAEAELDEMMVLMEEDIEKQAHLLDSLKDWLEMVRDEEMQLEEVPLTDLIEQLDTRINVVGSIDFGSLPTMAVCPVKFSSALEHLIRNGLVHNDQSSPEVFVYAENNCIVIEDNGRGFDPEKFDLLCQPFQQLTTDHQGSGMGLAIAKGICDSHGFRLAAESAPGKGSRLLIEY